jgi:basic amino acid/polyamine antiporter, APA family
MPEELAYARKASGLVRGLSFWDVLGIGLAFLTPIYAIWYVIGFSLSVYPKAQLVIAILISVATIVWASPIVWGVLGGTMPRSGGEYVYNSRIITPAVALGASFAAIMAQFYWNLFNASLVASPSLAVLGQYLGWHSFTNYVTSKAGATTISIIGFVIAFFIVGFGMKFFHRISLYVVGIIIGGVVIMNLMLTFSSHASFVHSWDAQAAKYHSVTYHAFVAAAGKAAGSPMPHTWSWGDTFGATAGVFMLVIWAFGIAYVGGEVKRPDKTVMMAQWVAVLAPVVLCLWAVVALGHLVDFSFLRAAAYQDYRVAYGGTPTGGYTLPYSTSYMSLVYIAAKANPVMAVVISFTFLVNVLWLLTVALIMCQRAMFAWGMDRMGPRWFTSINHRFASPIGMYALVAGISAFMSIAYWYLFPSILSGLVATGMQLVSVFAVTAISAILLPYRKKVAHIWDASPYRRWTFLGVPVLTYAGVVYLAYVIALIYFAFFDTKSRELGFAFTGKAVFLMIGAWAAGIAWYYAWKFKSTRAGVDVAHMTYGELPPE